MSNWPTRLMIYGAGEAVDGANALAPQIQEQLRGLVQVCTNPSVAATAQLDASDVPTKRLVLDPSGRQPILSLPNIDVGDPQNLIDYVDWSETICPADRTVLVLSGHGAAWQDNQVDAALGIAGVAARRSLSSLPERPGALRHPRSIFGSNVTPAQAIARAVLVDSHDRDYLSNAELGAVCDKIATKLGRPLDVIIFDACLMSAWEILFELQGSVSTVVASIDELSSAGIDLAGPAAQLTAGKGVLDATSIASTFASGFEPKADFDSCVAINLSSTAWKEATKSFGLCCGGVLTWLKADDANRLALQSALAVAAASVVQYQGGGLADVGSMAISLSNLQAVPQSVTDNAKAAVASLQSCILGRSSGFDYQHAMGLSIFSPSSRTVYSANRADYSRLQFPNQTGWLAVLDAVFS